MRQASADFDDASSFDAPLTPHNLRKGKAKDKAKGKNAFSPSTFADSPGNMKFANPLHEVCLLPATWPSRCLPRPLRLVQACAVRKSSTDRPPFSTPSPSRAMYPSRGTKGL
jgi:hypothetical protein